MKVSVGLRMCAFTPYLARGFAFQQGSGLPYVVLSGYFIAVSGSGIVQGALATYVMERTCVEAVFGCAFPAGIFRVEKRTEFVQRG